VEATNAESISLVLSCWQEQQMLISQISLVVELVVVQQMLMRQISLDSSWYGCNACIVQIS
jgi:hypothetical protein